MLRVGGGEWQADWELVDEECAQLGGGGVRAPQTLISGWGEKGGMKTDRL